MSEGAIPAELKYTRSHEWVRMDGDLATVGVTDHAQSELTDIVYVDLNLKAKTVAAGQVVLVLESVKTVADVYAPVAGEVTDVNAQLKAHPDYVNRFPYAEGWIFKIRPSGPIDPATLLSAEEYRTFLQSGG
ncbi:MAG TPA: glycine cleavage system protein GcvH [Thermoplasmata archaeon]|nr:glycine cleavage system protein GcvH [Thermoplasmata archaeon]